MYLRQLEPDMAAFIGLQTCLNLVSAQPALQSLGLSIGTRIDPGKQF
jgi:hypothetical protein